MSKNKNQQGLSILEIIIAVAIIGIISVISISAFSSLVAGRSVEKETANILSQFEKARTNSINSVDFSEHGISFASSSVTVFSGTSLASAVSLNTYELAPNSTIFSSSLSNATTTFYFQKLTGKPSATGTVTVRHANGSEKVIIIYATGYVEVQ